MSIGCASCAPHKVSQTQSRSRPACLRRKHTRRMPQHPLSCLSHLSPTRACSGDPRSSRKGRPHRQRRHESRRDSQTHASAFEAGMAAPHKRSFDAARALPSTLLHPHCLTPPPRLVSFSCSYLLLVLAVMWSICSRPHPLPHARPAPPQARRVAAAAAVAGTLGVGAVTPAICR